MAVSERRGAVTSGGERRYESDRRFRGEWVHRDELAPPPDRGIVVVVRSRRLGEPSEGKHRSLRQPSTFTFDPTLVLRRVADKPTIEERPAIKSDRATGIATVERILELRDVAPNHLRIQAQHLTGRAHNRFRSQIAP